ncbi:MAG: cell division protein FtsA [Bacteroidota bacterium]|jgi:cell division protein FtsA
MKNEIIVGLDIGTTKIACIVGRYDEHGKVEILGIGKSESVGVQRGVVVNIDRTVESIKKAVSQASEKSNVDIKIVNVGIAGQHIRSTQHQATRTRSSMDEEISQVDIDIMTQDIRRIPVAPGEDIIHALPQDFTVDQESGIKDPIGMAGIRMKANYHVITGQISQINNIYRCVRKAGLEVAKLTLEPLASSAAVLTDEEMEAGVALVDIGGGTTDIAIFHDGIIRHTAVIPFGGNIITEDIKNGCFILPKYAEVLKVNHGFALEEAVNQNAVIAIPGLAGHPRREISTLRLTQIIQARMEEILDYVHGEIVSSGFSKQLIGGIVMTGGGAQLRHMKQLVEYHTGMHCRVGYPHFHVSSSKDDATKLTPILSTGVGLLMTYENNEMQKNLFQETITAQVVEEVVSDIKVELEEQVAEPVNQAEEVVVSKSKKKGGIMESLDWLRQKFENQFKDNIE